MHNQHPVGEPFAIEALPHEMRALCLIAPRAAIGITRSRHQIPLRGYAIRDTAAAIRQLGSFTALVPYSVPFSRQRSPFRLLTAAVLRSFRSALELLNLRRRQDVEDRLALVITEVPQHVAALFCAAVVRRDVGNSS